VTRIWRFPETVDQVWRALTEPRELAAWLLPNDFVPRVGHRFAFRGGQAFGLPEVLHCEVLEIDPPSRLVVRWDRRPGSAETVVEFTVQRVGAETELRIDHHETAPPLMRAGPEPGVWDWGEDVRRALVARLRALRENTRGEVMP
jgi:uncharacterized protein YndB with AHSA1/START domain